MILCSFQQSDSIILENFPLSSKQ
eukprot:UN10641